MNARTEDFIDPKEFHSNRFGRPVVEDRIVADDRSAGSIVKELMHEVPRLFTKELALARSELRESLQQTRRGAMEVATGGLVLAGGYIVLLMAAVYALSEVMEPWLAALLVGGIAAAIGFAMVKAGTRHFNAEELRPDRTIEAVHKDADAIRGATQ